MAEVDFDHLRKRIITELPLQARWHISGMTLDFDFSRSQLPLRPVSEADVNGPLEEEWRILYIFGEQDFAEGGGAQPYLVIDSSNGEVRALDLEDDYQAYLNSDIESFIKTFKLFDDAIRLGAYSPDLIKTAASEIRGFGQSEWSLMLDAILSED